MNLPYLRFHDIRHSSCTFKSAVSGGDIKSVQGDTGHANATTLLNIYGHTQDKRRKALSMEAYRQFYSGHDSDNDTEADNIVDLIKNNTDLQKKVISALISD